MFISSFKQIIYFGELFFTRNEIFLLLRNESAHDDKSCKLEKDCLSIHIVTFPRTLNSTNLQKPERFFYLPKEIVQDLKFQGNSNHFAWFWSFSQICEVFRKFKKETCSRIVGSNFSRHFDGEKPRESMKKDKNHQNFLEILNPVRFP